MTTLDWATTLDRLYEDPADPSARAWAEAAVASGSCTPGQRRAVGLLVEGTPIAHVLARTSTRLSDLLRHVPDDLVIEAPGPNEWSSAQVVHHLADNEAVNAVRIRSILTEENPTIFGYDSDPWTRFFHLEPVEHALERFRVSRRNTLALIDSLTSEELDRTGFLSYRGTESLRVLLAVLAGHDRDHLDQLQDTLAQVGADVGPSHRGA